MSGITYDTIVSDWQRAQPLTFDWLVGHCHYVSGHLYWWGEQHQVIADSTDTVRILQGDGMTLEVSPLKTVGQFIDLLNRFGIEVVQ